MVSQSQFEKDIEEIDYVISHYEKMIDLLLEQRRELINLNDANKK